MEGNGFIGKTKVNFKIYDVTNWITNNYNTHISRYLKKKRQSNNEIFQLIESNMRNIFLEKLYTKCGGKTSTRSYFKKSKLKTSLDRLLLKPGPGPWAQTLKNLDPEKHGC